MASTLKLEKVDPPSSGSLVSIPSMAKTVVAPRWPFTANCWVKFAAPLVSVMVPAASKSNWLKSRLLSGNVDTSFLDKRLPPLEFDSGAASGSPGFWSCGVGLLANGAAPGFDSVDAPSWPNDDPCQGPSRASVAGKKAKADKNLCFKSKAPRFMPLTRIDEDMIIFHCGRKDWCECCGVWSPARPSRCGASGRAANCS